MAKETTTTTTVKQPQFEELTNTFRFFPFKNRYAPFVVLILLGLIFNLTTLNNEYALDDGIIIHQNDHVIKGTAGIKGIITKDAYESFYRRMNATDQLAGGRYRPLSVVSFAIEQEFIQPYRSGLFSQPQDLNGNGKLDDGKVKPVQGGLDNYEYNDFTDLNGDGVAQNNECNACWDLNKDFKNNPEEDINNDGVYNEVDCQVKGASLRHFINIITFIIGILMLFLVFRNYMFKDNHDLAFLSALLFLMHPLHSEAIANVKSRDEIFSLIFISLTFFYSFRYIDYAGYVKEKGFIQSFSAPVKHVLFFLITAAVVYLVYTFTSNKLEVGLIIFIPTAAIGALVIYSSYISFIKNEKLTKQLILAWAAVSFLLALLSKEYAVVLVALIPVAIWCFSKLEFNLNTFIFAMIGYLLLGAGLFLFYKSYSHYKTHEASKTMVYLVLGIASLVGGLKLFPKYFKEYQTTFIVLTLFIFSALVMLMMKQNYDIKARPGSKADYSYWFFPLIFLIFGVFLFGSKKKDYGTLMAWHFFIMLFYLGMRLIAVKLKPGVPDTEILNNPYLLATGEERFMTKALVLLKYFGLCWFPHPLTSDYSFNTILYRHFTSWDSILSIVLHISLAYYGFKLLLQKHIMGFAIAVYFAFLLMIGNILMDIGATMGERLLFHSTIGFCIGLAWLILKGFDKIPNMAFASKRVAFFVVLSIMTFLYGCKTWERNWDWKNDITLFLKDVEIIPNSVLVLGNAGARYIDLADTKTFVENPADTNLVQLKELNPNPVPPNYGTIEKFGQKIKPLIGSIEVYHVDSVESKSFNRKRTAFLEKGLKYLKHAVELHPRYVNGYLNLGLGSYKLGRDRDALYYWKHAEALYPNNPYLKNYYIVFYNDLLQRGYKKAQRGQLDSAIYELNKSIILDRLNPEGFYNLGGAYYQKQNYAKAKFYWEQCVKLNPNHVQAVAGLKTIVTVPVQQPVAVKQ